MNITFNEAIESYLRFVKLKDKQTSYRNISNRINLHIKPYCETYKIHEFKAIDYLNWQSIINELGYKYRYKKTLHSCFVTFLNYCINFYDLNIKNVATTVGNFKNNDIEEPGKTWTIEEFNKFINVVDSKCYSTLFKFLYFTGARMGEALALTFEDINNNTITINKTMTRFFEDDHRIITTPKSKKSIRNISIDNLLKYEILDLREYYITHFKDYNDKFYIFGGNKIIPPTTLTRKKNEYCKLAEVKQIKIHEFRHSHACLLFQNNVPIEEISYRLGHSTISMTMDVYLRFIPRNEKRVLETLNSLRTT